MDLTGNKIKIADFGMAKGLSKPLERCKIV